MIIAIYGMGLIGGSLGRALVKRTSHTVLGTDIDNSALLKAKMMYAYHEEVDDENIKKADIVFIAVNPKDTLELLEELPKKIKPGGIIADTCGVKRIIVKKMEVMREKYQDIEFVGVHPMAGREYSGIKHSTISLFEKAFFILTSVHSSIQALVAVKGLFEEIGCEGIVTATAEHHDKVIAYTSQLAHIVSSSYVKSPMSLEHHGFSAGSFKDLTRVAKLNPKMWSELFLANRDNLLAEVVTLIEHLEEYKEALAEGDEKRLYSLLAEGVAIKEQVDNILKK